MGFSAFDTKQTEAYAAEAKRRWGHTDAYAEYADKSRGRAQETERALAEGLMLIFADFGKCKKADPACAEAQALVQRLQAYITEHYYHCTPQILYGLGQMYAAGGAFTENIDKAGGDGTAVFVSRAIAACCAPD